MNLLVSKNSSIVNKKTLLFSQCLANDFSTVLSNPKIKSFGYVKPPFDFKLRRAISGLLQYDLVPKHKL